MPRVIDTAAGEAMLPALRSALTGASSANLQTSTSSSDAHLPMRSRLWIEPWNQSPAAMTEPRLVHISSMRCAAIHSEPCSA